MASPFEEDQRIDADFRKIRFSEYVNIETMKSNSQCLSTETSVNLVLHLIQRSAQSGCFEGKKLPILGDGRGISVSNQNIDPS